MRAQSNNYVTFAIVNTWRKMLCYSMLVVWGSNGTADQCHSCIQSWQLLLRAWNNTKEHAQILQEVLILEHLRRWCAWLAWKASINPSSLKAFASNIWPPGVKIFRWNSLNMWKDGWKSSITNLISESSDLTMEWSGSLIKIMTLGMLLISGGQIQTEQANTLSPCEHSLQATPPTTSSAQPQAWSLFMDLEK